VIDWTRYPADVTAVTVHRGKHREVFERPAPVIISLNHAQVQALLRVCNQISGNSRSTGRGRMDEIATMLREAGCEEEAVYMTRGEINFAD
jgi:hypothetical protein